MAQRFYAALCLATANSTTPPQHGNPATTLVDWETTLVGQGLLNRDANGRHLDHSSRTLFNRHKRDLITANWVVCNETLAWTVGPNPRATF